MFIFRSQGVIDASETHGKLANLLVNIFTPGTNKLVNKYFVRRYEIITE